MRLVVGEVRQDGAVEDDDSDSNDSADEIEQADSFEPLDDGLMFQDVPPELVEDVYDNVEQDEPVVEDTPSFDDDAVFEDLPDDVVSDHESDGPTLVEFLDALRIDVKGNMTCSLEPFADKVLARVGYFPIIARPHQQTVTCRCYNPLHGSNCRLVKPRKRWPDEFFKDWVLRGLDSSVTTAAAHIEMAALIERGLAGVH